MLKIDSTEKYSIAEELRIKGGDTLLSINGRDIGDILDYIFFDAQEDLDITIKSRNGKIVTHEISKEAEEPLGLNFGAEAEIAGGSCLNNCIFCFVDQLPPNMRDTLYFKDDDYRLSFVSGNYVTLTNIGEEEINRIIEQKISPLYISVHAADTVLRRKMLGNENAEDIMAVLKRLSQAGITTHCQIVLCGGINDGSALEDTVSRLYELYPAVNSLAVVPVGLTAHRQGLYPIPPLSEAQAAAAVSFCESFNKAVKSGFVYCSDEMYLKANRPLPQHGYYGEFVQIENGVGLLRKFEREFLDALTDADAPSRTGSVALITGVSAESFLKGLAERFTQKFPEIRVSVVPVENNFFGQSITVAGLVTGSDILRSLGKISADKIIIPKCMLKEFSTVFLDNIKLEDIVREAGVKVEVCAVDGAALVEKLLAL